MPAKKELFQPQRRVPATIWTDLGWVSGFFHLGERRAFMESINQVDGFFKLTTITLATTGQELPFLALQRDAVRVIVPRESEELLESLPPPPEAQCHCIRCVLEDGYMAGDLLLLPNIRVSDYLAHQSGFVLLRNAETDLWEEPSGSEDARSGGTASAAGATASRRPTIPYAVINAKRILAVIDEGARGGRVG